MMYRHVDEAREAINALSQATARRRVGALSQGMQIATGLHLEVLPRSGRRLSFGDVAASKEACARTASVCSPNLTVAPRV